jgi:hypothetical protein
MKRSKTLIQIVRTTLRKRNESRRWKERFRKEKFTERGRDVNDHEKKMLSSL